MDINHYLFTSESVSEGHPDKIADQISDAVLDEFLAQDPESKVACETLVTTGQVVIAGEVNSEAYIDLQAVARKVITDIGYDRSDLRFDGNACGILSALHEQSADINPRSRPRDKGRPGCRRPGYDVLDSLSTRLPTICLCRCISAIFFLWSLLKYAGRAAR